MFKRSDGKRRRSKRSKRCKSLLGKKIGINIHEGIYANKSQAIAVAYSQIRKKHPSCRRILGKKSRKSRRRSKKIMDGEQINGTRDNGLLSEQQKQDFLHIFEDNNYKFFNSITLKSSTSPVGAALNSVNKIYIKKDNNENVWFTYNHHHSPLTNSGFSINIISGYELADLQPLPAGIEPVFEF